MVDWLVASSGRRPSATDGSGSHLPHLVGPERQRPGGRHPRILLAQRSGRRVARVHEEPLAGLRLAPVEVVEGGDGHVDLAPHLEHLGERAGRRVEPLRDGGHGGDVGRHVLAGGAVPPGGRLHEPAVAVEEGDGQPVDLELALEGGVGRHLLPHTIGPGPQLLGTERVVQAHHRDVVDHGGEQRGRRRTDLGGRRVGHGQVRVLGLELAQLADQGVVLGIGDLGVVERVVALVVVGDQGPQLGGPGDGVAPTPASLAPAHRTTPEPTTESGRSAS